MVMQGTLLEDKMNINNSAARIAGALDNFKYFSAIRNGMVMAIPAILTGAFSILLLNLPIVPYQTFLIQIFNGALLHVFRTLTACTMDLLVLILIVTISQSYEKLLEIPSQGILVILCLSSYAAFGIDYQQGFSITIFDKTRLLEAMVIIFLASQLYVGMTKSKLFRIAVYSEGADTVFNSAMSSILPVVIITGFFAILKISIWKLTGVSDLNYALMQALGHLFLGEGRSLLSMLKFVFLVHAFWFLGIHGSNLLENVARNLFSPGVEVNMELIRSGFTPTEIVSKSFLDTFILMGGCGTTICLIAALILFDKRRNIRNLSFLAASQVLFNINEIIIFGFPIVLNVSMLIPFISVPVILTITSYLAVFLNLVPHTVHHVEWTTPIFLSGYIATGSLRGSLLQAINLAIGIAVYIPFVKLNQSRYYNTVKHDIEELTRIVKSAEIEGVPPNLSRLTGSPGSVCKMLTSELKSDLKTGALDLYYQPQVSYDGRVTGFEALLRWSNADYGFIYPPLTIALADEANIMNELGDFITEKACTDIEHFNRETSCDLCISINYSATQISEHSLKERVKKILSRHSFSRVRLGIEITEQSFLASSELVSIQLSSLKELGISIILDDFGMGHSSLLYLQRNHFDEIKLDGSLVRELQENPRCSNIIESIVHLSHSLGFTVLAEFVDTEGQQEILHNLGCNYYQGYLFSPALPLDQAIEYLKKKSR